MLVGPVGFRAVECTLATSSINVLPACPYSRLFLVPSLPIAYQLFHTNIFPMSRPSLVFLMDPSGDPALLAHPVPVIKELIPLLFTASRMVSWPLHHTRLRGLGLAHFLSYTSL